MLTGGLKDDYVFGGIDADWQVELGPPPPLPIDVLDSRRCIAADLADVGWTQLYEPQGEPPVRLLIYRRDAEPDRQHGERATVTQRGFVAALHYEAAGSLRWPKRGDLIHDRDSSWYVEGVEVDRQQGEALRFVLTLTGDQLWYDGQRAMR